jgi:hypothetical protein
MEEVHEVGAALVALQQVMGA